MTELAYTNSLNLQKKTEEKTAKLQMRKSE